MRGLWLGSKHIWESWKVVSRKIGTFQARVLLTILYAVLVLPFGLMVRWLADPLRIKKRPTQWLDYTDAASDMRGAKRQ
jgi:hypothetical protein